MSGIISERALKIPLVNKLLLGIHFIMAIHFCEISNSEVMLVKVFRYRVQDFIGVYVKFNC